MKIIILGGSKVGGALAENLIAEHHDVSIIDCDVNKLNELNQRLDIQTFCGNASHPDVLEGAGADDADLLIAVTNNDEVNLVACQAAYSLFNIPTKIARIRSNQYLDYPELFGCDNLPVDVFISPEQLITDRVSQLIAYPGALQVLDFAGGKIKLVAVNPAYGGALVNKTVAEMGEFIDIDSRIVAIYQGDHPITPKNNTIIQVGDEVFFLAAEPDIASVLQALGCADSPYRHIMIAGGGHIGLRLAQSLEFDYHVKIIDHNYQRSLDLATILNKTTVLHGDVADRDLLINENIDKTDVFCALTDDDENNIMSCLLAKRLGVKKVIALISHGAYIDLIEGGDIDIVISAEQATTGSILRYIRQGDVANVYSLRRGAAEALEIIVHGDEHTSKVVKRCLKDIKLPFGVTMGAIFRDDKTMMAHNDLVLEANDHVILFVGNKKNIKEVEKLFQVSLGFFDKR